MGSQFPPEYLKLAIAGRNLKVDRVLALTATATPTVVEDIRREFAIPPEAYVNTGFHRPNLFLEFTPTSLSERDETLKQKLAASSLGPTIVYVTLQGGSGKGRRIPHHSGFFSPCLPRRNEKR